MDMSETTQVKIFAAGYHASNNLPMIAGCPLQEATTVIIDFVPVVRVSQMISRSASRFAPVWTFGANLYLLNSLKVYCVGVRDAEEGQLDSGWVVNGQVACRLFASALTLHKIHRPNVPNWRHGSSPAHVGEGNLYGDGLPWPQWPMSKSPVKTPGASEYFRMSTLEQRVDGYDGWCKRSTMNEAPFILVWEKPRSKAVTRWLKPSKSSHKSLYKSIAEPPEILEISGCLQHVPNWEDIVELESARAAWSSFFWLSCSCAPWKSLPEVSLWRVFLKWTPSWTKMTGVLSGCYRWNTNCTGTVSVRVHHVRCETSVHNQDESWNTQYRRDKKKNKNRNSNSILLWSLSFTMTRRHTYTTV